MKINTITAKSILTKSGLPGSDWVINPYNGCPFACMYCYAAQIARWKHPDEEWGSFLDVKINAPELLEKKLCRLQTKHNPKDFGSIFFSSITDPYIGHETKYELTRKCLQTLADFGYAGKIAIQTKSPLVTRDIDVLKQLKKVTIGFTVTTLDDEVSRFLEVNAPPVSSRLHALKILHDKGISTYAFVGPILPYFSDKPEVIEQILDELKLAGVTEVWFEHINLNSRIKKRLYDYLKRKSPELVRSFEQADTEEYRQELNEIILRLIKERNMTLGLGEVIHHRSTKKH